MVASGVTQGATKNRRLVYQRTEFERGGVWAVSFEEEAGEEKARSARIHYDFEFRHQKKKVCVVLVRSRFGAVVLDIAVYVFFRGVPIPLKLFWLALGCRLQTRSAKLITVI